MIKTSKRKIYKGLKIALYLIMLGWIAIFTTNKWVEKSAIDKLYTDVKNIPSNKVGLLLGTGKTLSNGHINLYYKYRIEAAVTLYNAGKISYILVSGDNGHEHYDEPTTIKNDLIAKGIPANKIFLDYAGFRTLDSVVRCKVVFGQKRITIISQSFHNERALFIADRKGVEAVAFNAEDVSMRYGFKTRLRERLARVKMMLDLGLGKQPKFLGEKVLIQ